MQKRRIGGKDLQISKVSFGETLISEINPDSATSVVRITFDLGIYHVDTAKLDEDSEEKRDIKRRKRQMHLINQNRFKN